MNGDIIQSATIEELIADFKARGMDKYYAWDRYIIACNLQPKIDAKEFYEIYDEVKAKKFNPFLNTKFNPTHIMQDFGPPKEIEIVEEGDKYIKWTTLKEWGSTPKRCIKMLEEIGETENISKEKY